MSTFIDQLATDLAVFLNTDEFAQDVIYNDGNGPVTIPAVVDFAADGVTPGDQASILVKKSDVSSPDYRQTFTIDSVVWYVRPVSKDKDFVLSQDDQCYLLAISKNERFNQWRT
ncbi:MAG: hypothetical protein DRH26_12110 [Deltaproteobacteria bacterium]|nr:MAG: hypothetical protein DRH26_12110 [Deltaproteobacteria bacterium]